MKKDGASNSVLFHDMKPSSPSGKAARSASLLIVPNPPILLTPAGISTGHAFYKKINHRK